MGLVQGTRQKGRDIDACELALEFDGLRSRWELNQDLRQEEARSTAEQEVYDVLAEAGEAPDHGARCAEAAGSQGAGG